MCGILGDMQIIFDPPICKESVICQKTLW